KPTGRCARAGSQAGWNEFSYARLQKQTFRFWVSEKPFRRRCTKAEGLSTVNLNMRLSNGRIRRAFGLSGLTIRRFNGVSSVRFGAHLPRAQLSFGAAF